MHILADRQSGRFVDGDLVEFACFAHDIGNPPFGHAGERELNGLMKECGGFEGNAQSLRIITETAWSSRGIRPTKASIDSILKYKESWRIKEDPPEQRSKFLYDYQDQLIEIIAVGKERSIECQIMDLADDIGNALIDFTDGVRAGIITKEKVRDWKSSEAEPDDDFAITNVLKAFDDNVMDIFSSVRVRDCVGALEFSGGADPDRRGNCSVWPNRDYAAFLRSLKRISSHFLFNDPEIRGQDNFGAFIIRTLFNIFVLHYCERGSDILYRTGIVPQDRHERLQTGAKDSKLRLICDYLSGMTDDYAELMFQRAVEIAL